MLWLVLVVTLSACTWVQSTSGSGRIQVVPIDPASDQLSECERLGETRASVRARIAGVHRRSEKVADEVETLARTSAMEMGGDTLVPLGPLRFGAREFAVFRCRPPEY